VEQGEKLSRAILYLYTVLNFNFILWRKAFGEVLVLTWRSYFGRNFDVSIGRAA
jgi:hypothetical protein